MIFTFLSSYVWNLDPGTHMIRAFGFPLFLENRVWHHVNESIMHGLVDRLLHLFLQELVVCLKILAANTFIKVCWDPCFFIIACHRNTKTGNKQWRLSLIISLHAPLRWNTGTHYYILPSSTSVWQNTKQRMVQSKAGSWYLPRGSETAIARSKLYWSEESMWSLGG